MEGWRFAGRALAVVAALALLVALTGDAGAEPHVDCNNAGTQMELNYCAERDYLAADADLNEIYPQAIEAMRQIDSRLEPGRRGAVESLRAAQRAWIPFRDKACEAEGYLVSGGSMMALIVYGCLERLTRQRVEDLEGLVYGMGN
ncbi:uncharacterized protein YecT (DUF1311 family) [Tepidamorphus gemmatus]|uniref:Uncharacterized protein YecT (DUF1311 family) n=1 Tax=Tepidamorphus gemmatus TaxID=747076 RepID=A0A4R3M721_9HYPH|nr:lysozyme inhibitor LprI family protein [Tepidamorphus gemmatus]TCT09244.1 uncharacterized protein YecT (DUF1311 family) [Tepidamorphus gemmatus]